MLVPCGKERKRSCRPDSQPSRAVHHTNVELQAHVGCQLLRRWDELLFAGQMDHHAIYLAHESKQLMRVKRCHVGLQQAP